MDILCSIGANVDNIHHISKMIEAGMDIPRFNFSHANYDKVEELIKDIKDRYPDIPIFQDLQGNKLRVGKEFERSIKVHRGEIIYFSTEEFHRKHKNNRKYTIVPISFDGKLSDLAKVKVIYMKDATMEFKVLGKNENAIKTEVVIGGVIRAEKGLNAPGMERSHLGLTSKDKNDAIWGVEHGVDIICLSYVTCAQNIMELKDLLKQLKKYKKFKMPKIWSKIECREAIENFEEILKVSDGIMIGRGDLIAEVDMIEVPIIQDRIIKKMKKSTKKLVIATYVLDSLKRNTTPMLSEVNDIYNFMKEKVDGFMLAGEVTFGNNPLKTIELFKNIINQYDNI
jgi:pyruvate kinase